MAGNLPDEQAVNGKWQFQLPAELRPKVDTAVEKGGYTSRAEFLRAAVREKLEKMGLL